MSDPWIERDVGGCRIESTIGEGGCGRVYRGTDLMLGRPVAVKVLHGNLAARSDVAARFRTEAHTLARLSHPNIATLYSFHRETDTYLMVMEFVEGRTFDELIRAKGGLAPEEALPLFCQALDGIQYAHEHGVIHRDLKGSNLMRNRAGVVKVMDFGIARALWTPGITQADHPLGTPEYMSPEQVRSEEIDARADVYSLGVLLFKMLTGRLPFTGDSHYEILRAQVEQQPPRIRELVPGIPEALEAAIGAALAKDRDERLADAGAFRSRLEEAGLIETPVASAAVEVLRQGNGYAADPHTTPLPPDAEPASDDAPDEEPTGILPGGSAPEPSAAPPAERTLVLRATRSREMLRPLGSAPGLMGLAVALLLVLGLDAVMRGPSEPPAPPADQKPAAVLERAPEPAGAEAGSGEEAESGEKAGDSVGEQDGALSPVKKKTSWRRPAVSSAEKDEEGRWVIRRD